MDIIFIIATIQAFFLMFLLLNKRGKTLADKVLAAWMGSIGLHLLLVYFHAAGVAFKYPHLLGLNIPFPLIHGPFIYIYLDTLSSPKPVFKKSYYLHALPFVVVLIAMLTPFYLRSAAYKLHFVEHILPQNPPILAQLIQMSLLISGIAYTIYSFFQLKWHQKRIGDNFSYTEKVNLNWMRYLMIGISTVWGSVIVLFPLEVYFKLLPSHTADIFIFGSLSIFVFLVGYFGIMQAGVFTHAKNIAIPSSGNEAPQRYEKSGLKDTEARERKDQLLKLMEEEQLYLEPKLSLGQLAERLAIHPNYLSQIINEQLGQNFYHFVNAYRVKAFKEKVVDPHYKHLTILAIAFECGFNSKSSFNNVFKKMTGKTPSSYLKSASSSN